MGSYILRFTFSATFKLLLCFLCINIITTTSQVPNPFEGLACAVVNCGEGTCKGSNSTFGYECDCNPGWKQIPLIDFVIPSCVLPNCTVSFQCGSETPPPLRLPILNVTSPCNLVFCGQGDCVVSGSSYYCQCDNGYANFLDNPSFGCFKQCYFGADCKSLELEPPPPPPSTSSAPPKTGTKDRQANTKGSNGPSNNVENFQQLILVMISLVFLIL